MYKFISRPAQFKPVLLTGHLFISENSYPCTFLARVDHNKGSCEDYKVKNWSSKHFVTQTQCCLSARSPPCSGAAPGTATTAPISNPPSALLTHGSGMTSAPDEGNQLFHQRTHAIKVITKKCHEFQYVLMASKSCLWVAFCLFSPKLTRHLPFLPNCLPCRHQTSTLDIKTTKTA